MWILLMLMLIFIAEMHSGPITSLALLFVECRLGLRVATGSLYQFNQACIDFQ